MKKVPGITNISIRFPDELAELARQEAKRQKRSLNSQILFLVEVALTELLPPKRTPQNSGSADLTLQTRGPSPKVREET
jgi:hypothetical protein